MKKEVDNIIAEKNAEILALKLSEKMENNEINIEKSLNIMAAYLRLAKTAVKEEELINFVNEV